MQCSRNRAPVVISSRHTASMRSYQRCSRRKIGSNFRAGRDLHHPRCREDLFRVHGVPVQQCTTRAEPRINDGLTERACCIAPGHVPRTRRSTRAPQRRNQIFESTRVVRRWSGASALPDPSRCACWVDGPRRHRCARMRLLMIPQTTRPSTYGSRFSNAPRARNRAPTTDLRNARAALRPGHVPRMRRSTRAPQRRSKSLSRRVWCAAGPGPTLYPIRAGVHGWEVRAEKQADRASPISSLGPHLPQFL
jgi:hypothetical protein